ncbi:MAG: helix-turn-helix domain-containing protein [Nitrospirae bacterium]|nr:helix-turn-helix domain-containing protein [Nitrospirota bacterium]
MKNDGLMNLKEVAEYLRLNVSTVYNWSQKGKLPAIKMGKNWRFWKEDIDNWLKEQKNNLGKNA